MCGDTVSSEFCSVSYPNSIPGNWLSSGDTEAD